MARMTVELVDLDEIAAVAKALSDLRLAKEQARKKAAMEWGLPNAEEKEMYKEGYRVNAVKALRNRIGCGLYEAKEMLDHAVKTKNEKDAVAFTHGSAKLATAVIVSLTSAMAAFL
jgi:ribosomal protein L7/L12